MTLQVIGAGYGRTGTLSLKHALEELGFGPTYHMEEVFRHPSHVSRWLEYAADGTADWDRLFDRYGSAVDFPASCAWQDLAVEYPLAKVVLTVRDIDEWWTSTATTIYPTRTMFPAWVKRLVPFTRRWLDMTDRLVWSGIFGGRFEDRDHAKSVFEAHVEAVQERCDGERLLIFEVSQGWEPLCEFLDVPVPAGPFPRVNDSKSLRRRFAAIRWGTRLGPIAVLGAGAAVVVRRLRRPAVA
jgi:hypothetical protein